MPRRGNMLGVGGTRSNLPRGAMRGTGSDRAPGGGDPLAAKRELLRKMRESGSGSGAKSVRPGSGTGTGTGTEGRDRTGVTEEPGKEGRAEQ